jgi:hypothetical protein
MSKEGTMATKADFTANEWTMLQAGVTGAAMLVSVSDRGFTDSFGEANAMARFLTGQRTIGATELMREIATVHGTGFGLTSSPQKVQAETLMALRSSIATLSAKVPDEVEPYRALVLGVAQAVAEARGGAKPAETAMIATITEALAAD